ncbi:hypothetical protein A6R70_14640 [Agrobacterium rubi]|uniref:hypothetical protein n=1 Tax=Agrobacterium rubi TaxID=28099 RepID=UPI00201B4A77|nr:hypothetical protein [Agrobacterium rubi]MCL6653527.1 hypothetical protein [Agrobacterium rubi]
MSPEQYERWKDFSTRMARCAFPNATPARRTKIEDEVAHFFYVKFDDDPQSIEEVTDWDGSPSYVGDQVSSFLNPHYHEKEFANGRVEPRGNKFENQVSCCIRAGLDLASSPSGGVLGFTVGDLRAMYPEGLPDWVTEGYEPPITPDTPNDAGVWL